MEKRDRNKGSNERLPENKEKLLEKVTENGPERSEEPSDKQPLDKSEDVERDSDHKGNKRNVVYVAAQKMGLTVKWFLIFVILLVISFILVIAVIAVAVTACSCSDDSSNVCRSPSCLQASAQLLRHANISADPCEDFFTYSCGGWVADNRIPPSRSRWGIFEGLSYRARDEIRKIINTLPYPKKTSSVEWKVRHFYESCQMLEAIDSAKESPILKIINRLGGWNVLRTFSLYSWNLSPTLRILQAEYGVHPFFKLEVVTDARDPKSGKSIIRISPSGLGLPDRSYYYRSDSEPVVVAYKNYLKDIVRLLGATGPTAAKFADDMFHFEKRIAEITPTAEQQRKPLTTYNRISVSELQVISQSIPWLDILRAKYPKAAVSDETDVMVVSRQYLSDISNIISTTDRGALNNYAMWCFTAVYLPVLSKDFLDTLNLYRKETRGVQNPMQRWEICVEQTQKFFGFAVGALYARQTKDEERRQNEEVLHAMFTNIQNIIGEQISGSSWYEMNIRTRALEKLRLLTFQVGYPEEMFKSEFLDKYYGLFIVQKADFFQNILYGVEFLRHTEQRKLLEPAIESGWMAALNQDTLTYVSTANKIIVPEYLLQSPFFDAEYQIPLTYGSIGTHVAALMVQSVSEFGLLYDSDGSLREAGGIVNETKTLMSAQKKCFVSEMKSLRLEEEKVLNKTVLSAVTEISGVRQAYKALSVYLLNSTALARAVGEKSVKLQPALENFNSAALFFLSYGQTLCSDATIQQLDMDKAVNFHLGRKERLKSTLLQIREFSLAFHCKEGDAMHTTKQCGRVL